MTSTESSPKQETFLNLPNQLFGCFHSDDAARPAALPSARTFPKPDTGKEQHAFVAPLPKPSLFSAQGHSHFFLFACPWLWKYLAREGTYPHVLCLPDQEKEGVLQVIQLERLERAVLSKFPSCLGKKFGVMVRENSVGARSRNKAERKKIQISV